MVRHFTILFLSLVIIAGLGCSRDPKVRRQNFLQSGERYFDKGQYDAASIEFRRAVGADPSFDEGYYHLALASLHLQQWQNAYRALQRAIEINPRNVPARLQMAALQFAARQDEDARKSLQAVLSTDPKNVDAYLLLGRISLRDGQYEQGLKEFHTAAQFSPASAPALAGAGDAYSSLKRFPEAVASYKKAMAADATYLPAYLNLSEIYRVQSDSADQLSTLLDAVRQNPRMTAPYLALARLYVAQGSQEKLANLFAGLRSATSDSPAALLAIGSFYSRIGDTQMAKDILSSALTKDPKNSGIRRGLINVELARQEWDQAEALNSELLKRDAKDPEGRLAQARLQFIRGARNQSISSLENLVHDVPDMELAHYYLGVAYATQGQPSRAISALNDAVQQDADFLPAYVKLGEIHAQQNDAKLGLSFADKALEKNPGYLPALMLRANSLLQLGNTEAAGAELQALAKAQPNNPEVLERMGVLAVHEKQFAAAEKDFEDSLRARRAYIPALVDLAQLYVLQHRPEEAIAKIREQIAQTPNQSNLYEILGELYVQAKRESDAEQAFQQALQVNPKAVVAQIKLAQLYARDQKFTEAVSTAQSAVKEHPEYLPAYLLLGSFYEQTGAVQSAEQTYNNALQVNPDFAPALNNLAWLYCEHSGNLDLALSMAEKAKEKSPANPNFTDTLAWIQYRKGLYGSAVSSLQELVHNSPQSGTYQYHLGMALLKSGNPSAARAALERALSLHLTSQDTAAAKLALAQTGSRSL